MTDAILHAWAEPPGTRSGPRIPPRLLRTLARVPFSLLRVSVAIAVLTALVVLALSLATMRLAARDVAPVPMRAASAVVAPAWIDIVKPVRIYSLEAKDLAKLPLTYAARRRAGAASATREDVLVYGAWHADQPSLRLSLLRNGAEPAVSLDTAIVRQAADVGLSVGHSRLPETMATRFGSFEIADVETSKGAGVSGVPLQCSGFRLHLAKPVLSLDGFACGGEGHRISRRSLGCLIDRLDLASAGEDMALIDFFATTDLKRSANCDGVRLAPDLMHAAWLDDKEPAAPAASRRARRRH